jgi:hypothetical protein
VEVDIRVSRKDVRVSRNMLPFSGPKRELCKEALSIYNYCQLPYIRELTF